MVIEIDKVEAEKEAKRMAESGMLASPPEINSQANQSPMQASEKTLQSELSFMQKENGVAPAKASSRETPPTKDRE